VFGSAVVVGVLTLGLKGVSFFKEAFVASAFGTSDSYDACIVAMLLPMTIVGILSGSLNAALIPTYIDTREHEGAEAAQRLYSSILTWNAALLVGLSALMALTVDAWLPLIASGFNPAKLGLARQLLYWSLPLIVLTGFSTTWGALLNAGDRYALVAIAPVMQPAAILLTLGMLQAIGVHALLLGTVLGLLLEACLLGVALHRSGHTLLPRWFGATPAFRRVLNQYGACIGASFLVSGMTLVDQAFAASLGPRSNASLSYGSKIVSLVLSLGASALGTAILPQLSRLVSQGDWGGIRRFLSFYFKVLMGVTLPVTLLLIGTSGPIIRAVFERGSFSPEDTALVSSVQVYYFLRIPFSVCGVLVTRTLTALRANHVLLVMAGGSFALNALLDWWMVRHFGLAGIALATSICSVFTLCCLGAAMLRVLAGQEATGS